MICIAKKDPHDKLILVGDMNMPGIDWNQMPPEHCTQDQSLQLHFLDVLAEIKGVVQSKIDLYKINFLYC